MTIQFKKAERSQSKLRIGLAGPSGSGKTMSALKLARGIAGPSGKIAVIDTERGSASLYAHVTEFDVLELVPPYAPKNYVDAIQAAEDAGYNVIIIDSLSHAWSDEGGLLDQADKMSAGGNRFTAWASLTPQHRALVNGMLNSDAHIIATVRSKQEYAMERDEKTGKSSVKKLGMAPVQRDGMEYEFTTFFDIEQNHAAKTSKDRTDLFRDEIFMIDEKTGERLVDWLSGGKVVEKETNKDTRIAKKRSQIMAQLKMLGYDATGKTKEEVYAKVNELVQLDPTEANFEEIFSRLHTRIQENKQAGVNPANKGEPQGQIEVTIRPATSEEINAPGKVIGEGTATATIQ